MTNQEKRECLRLGKLPTIEQDTCPLVHIISAQSNYLIFTLDQLIYMILFLNGFNSYIELQILSKQIQ